MLDAPLNTGFNHREKNYQHIPSTKVFDAQKINFYFDPLIDYQSSKKFTL